jgi:membrane protease subunit (stomatin/prohibitin family)
MGVGSGEDVAGGDVAVGSSIGGSVDASVGISVGSSVGSSVAISVGSSVGVVPGEAQAASVAASETTARIQTIRLNISTLLYSFYDYSGYSPEQRIRPEKGRN